MIFFFSYGRKPMGRIESELSDGKHRFKSSVDQDQCRSLENEKIGLFVCKDSRKLLIENISFVSIECRPCLDQDFVDARVFESDPITSTLHCLT